MHKGIFYWGYSKELPRWAIRLTPKLSPVRKSYNGVYRIVSQRPAAKRIICNALTMRAYTGTQCPFLFSRNMCNLKRTNEKGTAWPPFFNGSPIGYIFNSSARNIKEYTMRQAGYEKECMAYNHLKTNYPDAPFFATQQWPGSPNLHAFGSRLEVGDARRGLAAIGPLRAKRVIDATV